MISEIRNRASQYADGTVGCCDHITGISEQGALYGNYSFGDYLLIYLYAAVEARLLGSVYELTESDWEDAEIWAAQQSQRP